MISFDWIKNITQRRVYTTIIVIFIILLIYYLSNKTNKSGNNQKTILDTQSAVSIPTADKIALVERIYICVNNEYFKFIFTQADEEIKKVEIVQNLTQRYSEYRSYFENNLVRRSAIIIHNLREDSRKFSKAFRKELQKCGVENNQDIQITNIKLMQNKYLQIVVEVVNAGNDSDLVFSKSSESYTKNFNVSKKTYHKRTNMNKGYPTYIKLVFNQ